MGKINLENFIIEQYKKEFGENSAMYRVGKVCDKSFEKRRMMEFAKQVLELAAENATIKVVEYAKHGGKIISESDLGQEISVDGYQQYYQCNKQSILDVINLIE